MTSYEIHSFIPGTRANPREMNENFNIVLEQIGTKANNDLSNLSQTGQDYIKNCSISKNIGELVYSCIPQTDSSLHLLDGSIIRSNGIYQNFVSYIANLNQSYPNLFTTESDWQDSVTQYGVCGKFVYDSVNNTVRLPKITGIVEGTTDVTALGNLVEAGLPVHTHTRGTMDITGRIYSGDAGVGPTDAFYTSGSANGPTGNYQSRSVIYFTASRNWTGSTSNPNYTENINNTTTVQPQTIKCFVYIVIANSSKTEIQVDIDEIATDLGGKADVDLSNISASQSVKNEIVSWGMPDYANGISLAQSTNSEQQFTTPSDGVIAFRFYQYQASTFNGYVYINNELICGGYSSGSNSGQTLSATALVNKNDIVRYKTNDSSILGYINLTFYPMKGAN